MSTPRRKKFVTIVLGAGGGSLEDNLTSYLLAPKNDHNFISLDAGTVLVGIKRAIAKGSFRDVSIPEDTELNIEGWILQNLVKAHLISHTHLDHVAGLVLNAPDGSEKDILGIQRTIDDLRDHFFNWKVWPNFSNEGFGRQLKKYRYIRLEPEESYHIDKTALSVTPFVLSHSGIQSTAFLVRSKEDYALYFGDTGPDAVEKQSCIENVWKAVAPIARKKRLRGIFLEVSFPDPRPDNQLFGHLTPSWMMKELTRLAYMTDSQNAQNALSGVTVFVTHIKTTFEKGLWVNEHISRQLNDLNNLNLRFVIPKQ